MRVPDYPECASGTKKVSMFQRNWRGPVASAEMPGTGLLLYYLKAPSLRQRTVRESYGFVNSNYDIYLLYYACKQNTDKNNNYFEKDKRKDNMRKMSKKTLVAVCCTGLLAVAGAGMALAQSPTVVVGGGSTENTGGPSGETDALLDMMRIWGTVTSVEDGRITIDNQSGVSFEGEIVLNISDEYTRVLDAVNGFPVQLSNIREGEVIYAYIGPAMTMSLPPQTTPEMIICQIPADFKVPDYVEVKSMTWQENGDWVLVANDETTYQIPGDCPIIPYLTRNMVTLEDVTESRKLLVWSDGENNAQRLVLFAEDVQ